MREAQQGYRSCGFRPVCDGGHTFRISQRSSGPVAPVAQHDEEYVGSIIARSFAMSRMMMCLPDLAITCAFTKAERAVDPRFRGILLQGLSRAAAPTR
jgi:hypothetical protein